MSANNFVGRFMEILSSNEVLGVGSTSTSIIERSIGKGGGYIAIVFFNLGHLLSDFLCSLFFFGSLEARFLDLCLVSLPMRNNS